MVSGSLDDLFHTDFADSTPWFAVDLGDPSVITQIIVYNRIECCGERLSNAEIRLFNGTSVPVSGVIGPITSGQLVWKQNGQGTTGGTYTINVDPPVIGRFMTIQNLNPSKFVLHRRPSIVKQL